VPEGAVRSGPPAWFIAATGLLTLACLSMAVAETSLWMHYLIDAGEWVSLAGLGFLLGAGVLLYSQRRLQVSLPLTAPWLLFPVITQGDQIIDNLSINWMRIIVHVLLALIFAAPVGIAVAGIRYAIAPRAGRPARNPPWLNAVPGFRLMSAGRVREGGSIIAAMLFVAEIWIAVQFLGLLMVATLILMIAGVLLYGFGLARFARSEAGSGSERLALALLLGGVALSLTLFFGYKNRPGAYQGSPSHFMDPNQPQAVFQLNRAPLPEAPIAAPPDPDIVRAALTGYARALEQLLEGYYVLDRNYNYDFHNRLFLRKTPLLADYRAAGLSRIAEAAGSRNDADRAAAAARRALPDRSTLGALVNEVSAYVEFTFARAAVLERMSAEFERTEAGLQHATHLYEGEGKYLGVQLAAILARYERVLSSPVTAPVTREFVTIGRAIHDKYANRIVGF
jgi:hypothetical protein